jgi:hypothetical protein
MGRSPPLVLDNPDVDQGYSPTLVLEAKKRRFCDLIFYPSTLANSWTLILLFSEMLKFSKIISSKSKNIVKENQEYSGIFHLLKCILQNK